MLVIPAIDIIEGKCVRLRQGDYAAKKIYADDPVEIAKKWEAQGASYLHVVDLDGARLGKAANLKVIENIAKSIDIPFQVGGGIRSLRSVRQLLSFGVARVMLGTIAIEQPELVKKTIGFFGKDKIVAAVDARHGKVAIKGWREQSDKDVGEVVTDLKKKGVKRFMYTDITKDGTLSEPDFEPARELIETLGIDLLLAGGVSSTEHLKKAEKMGVEGVIVGKALYEGEITLANALAAIT